MHDCSLIQGHYCWLLETHGKEIDCKTLQKSNKKFDNANLILFQKGKKKLVELSTRGGGGSATGDFPQKKKRKQDLVISVKFHLK